MRDGDMVRGEGRSMRVVQTFHQFARCVWIDGHGAIRSRWFEKDSLISLESYMRPRSLWPDPGQLEALEFEREQEAARVEAITEKAKRRKAARSRRKVAA